MTVLVADVGGTNTRLAIADGGHLVDGSLQHSRNTEYQSFYDMAEAYLSKNNIRGVASCCVAMAGPVSEGQGALTNVEWEISARDLDSKLGCKGSILMNDLTALGYSIARLPDKYLVHLHRSEASGNGNGQAVVVGIGTGFNICPVITETGSGTVCLVTEYGHSSLPSTICKMLKSELGPQAQQFRTTENLFSGPGLSRLQWLKTGESQISSEQIVGLHLNHGDKRSSETLKFFTKLLGVLCRDIAFGYLPMNGLYLAGSVARGLWESGMADVLVTEIGRNEEFGELLAHIPVTLVCEDSAALIGCAEVAGGPT